MKQNWDCAQIEDRDEKDEVMNWDEEDELKKQMIQKEVEVVSCSRRLCKKYRSWWLLSVCPEETR